MGQRIILVVRLEGLVLLVCVSAYLPVSVCLSLSANALTSTVNKTSQPLRAKLMLTLMWFGHYLDSNASTDYQTVIHRQDGWPFCD